MRLQSSVVAQAMAFAVVVASPAVLANQVVYDGFAPSFPIYANGGFGFSGPWTQGGFNAFASGYVPREDSLCFARLDTSGGSISAGAFSAINGAVRNLAQPLGQDNSTVYLSFLIQPRGTLNAGVFDGFFGLTLNGNLGNDLFIGKPGGGAEDQYVLEARGGSGQVPSNVQVKVGRTALLVLKAEFLSGNDVFTLYVNPSPGRREPAHGTAKTDLDLGTVSRLGIYSTGAFAIDEIRIGSTFADVVPVASHAHSHDSDDCRDDDHRDDR